MLYKDRKDLKYSLEVNELPDNTVQLLFSCDGGKFGTDELLDEYDISVKDLLDILQKEYR